MEGAEAASVAEELHPLQGQQQEQQESPETQQADQQESGGEDGEKKEAKTYTQDEVDRIAKKIKRNAAYVARKEAEAEYWRRQAEQAQTKPVTQQQAPEDERPKRDDFEDYEAFMRAEARFEARQEFKALQQQERQRSQQQSQATTDANGFNDSMPIWQRLVRPSRISTKSWTRQMYPSRKRCVMRFSKVKSVRC